jgi:hypothetical protein
MLSVQEIKNAITQLSDTDLIEFRQWFEKFNQQLVDKTPNETTIKTADNRDYESIDLTP